MTMDMFHLSQKLLGHFLIYVFSQMCNYINTTGAISGALTAVFSGVYVMLCFADSDYPFGIIKLLLYIVQY